ncbi:TrbI/VirB10 family protein [Acidipila rosea]|uniref:Type IV secretion system protein VirB10 n=1 Tax=Acidipila rosea TaxID=768535 RepID=A0A4R1L9W1_9BACT|nr:TrbI/VirB10 family protein [Acidipila rosea]TCK73753.1 type IV secretion system protein VirB10 [Acidipila rosea]
MARKATLAAILCLAASTQLLQSQSAAVQATPTTPGHTDVVVPAGTKVLLALKSGVNTKTAQAGDGVYLASTFPVVVNGRVAIPAGIYVQGVIDRVVRPGHIKGRAQVGMHFTTMIFPNGSVVTIPAIVNTLPGSDGPKVKDGEGTIEQAGNKGRDAAAIAQSAETGAGVGAIGGAVAGRPLQGLAYGALAGGAAGLIYTLFTRGNDLNLEAGQTIEMVLQRPLTLEESNLTGPDRAGANVIPTAQQPMPKPKQHILCPMGGLGCS